MTNALVAAQALRGFEDAERRAVALRELSRQQWEHRADGEDWNTAQIVHHLVVVGEKYIPLIESALAKARKVSEDKPVKHSILGNQMRQHAGPGGNAPVPRFMRPASDPDGPQTLETFLDQVDRFEEFCRRGVHVDLNTWSKMPVPLGRLRLGENLMLHAEHADRHLTQIEERLGLSRSS